MVRLLIVLALSLAAAHAGAQVPASRAPDPTALLAAAKAASGGAAWDAMRTQQSTVKLAAANLEGTVQRWSDIATGQSFLRYSIGPLTGAAGFDGKSAWTQDGADAAKVETAAPALELAANAAYRDRLAFWYPDRAKARIAYKERADADGRKFDVVTIVPEGGRPFEFWIGVDSRLIERLVEREAEVTRTEIYSDRRDVQGVKIPFHVRTTRGDPKMDEVVTVQKIEFNAPLTGVAFGPPAPRPEFAFPAGRASVDVDFEVFSGHTFVRVMLDGRGPFRMLFDAGGANVLAAETAALLAGKGNPIPRTLTVAATNLSGVELGRPALRRRRRRRVPAPGRRAGRRRGHRGTRVVRAHADQGRLRAVAPDAVRSGAIQGRGQRARACRSPRAAACPGCAAVSTASTARSRSTWAAAGR